MEHQKKSPTLGVVGGMGVFASIEFVKDCYRLYGQSNDSEKPRILLDVNTSIPGRSNYLLNDGPSPIDAIDKSITGLISAGADVIAIPCNTANIIVTASYLPRENQILDMNQIVQREVAANSKNRKVLILASKGILRSNVYSKSVEESAGLNIVLDSLSMKELDEVINIVKDSGYESYSQKKMTRFLQKIIMDYNPDTLILGCTELFFPKSLANHKLKIIDSRIELARAYIQMIRERNV